MCHVHASYLAIGIAVLTHDATGLLMLLCRAFRVVGGRPRGRQGLLAPGRFRHHAGLLGRPAEAPSSLPGGADILIFCGPFDSKYMQYSTIDITTSIPGTLQTLHTYTSRCIW